jgi:hypothetical protein
VVKNGGRVRLHSKSSAECRPLTQYGRRVKRMPTRSAVLDGQLCCMGADGLPRFYA